MKQMSTTSKMNSKRRSGGDHSAHGGGIPHASSLSKRQKVTKPLLKGDDSEEHEEDALASILPLRLTVLGGYLPLKDAGRFLLRVSKDMTMSIFEEKISSDGTVAAAANADRMGRIKDSGGGVVAINSNDPSYVGAIKQFTLRFKCLEQVWKILCMQKWRNPKVIEHLVSILGGDTDGGEMKTDWEKLFRQFLRTPPKPAIRASIKDYSFLFTLMMGSWQNCDSTPPLTSYALKGDKASEFLKTGESGWLELDEHVKVGNFANKKVFENSWRSIFGNMASTLHVLRKSDKKTCELNFEEDLEMFPPDGDEIEFFFVGGDIELVGDFIEIIDINEMEVMLGFTISRSLRGELLGQDDGSVDFRITHTYFSAKLFPPNGRGESYSWYSERGGVKSGATVADFLEQLKWE